MEGKKGDCDWEVSHVRVTIKKIAGFAKGRFYFGLPGYSTEGINLS
jgi:hypothetical protein